MKSINLGEPVKAISIYPGKGNPHITDIPEPFIKNGNDVKAEVLSVGICGTDRDEVAGGRADAPEGENELVIGHEMLCRVTDTGKSVNTVKPGDFAVFTVRRGCGECIPCNLNRSDMCLTGRYKERGIKQLHGFQSEYIVDSADYIVRIPGQIRDIAVLTEPASIAEKAINEAVSIQKGRIPGYDEHPHKKQYKVLVAGIGTVGLLAAFILEARGAEVWGLDIVDDESFRPSILRQIGGKYINGTKIRASEIDDAFGEMDLILEAAGVSELGFNLTDALGINGIYIMTGIPEGIKRISIPGNSLMRQMVLKNQVILGSVNASLNDFHSAVEDLTEINSRHNGVLRRIITRSVPVDNFMEAINRYESDIKTVTTWKEF